MYEYIHPGKAIKGRRREGKEKKKEIWRVLAMMSQVLYQAIYTF